MMKDPSGIFTPKNNRDFVQDGRLPVIGRVVT